MKKYLLPKELSISLKVVTVLLFFSCWWYGLFPEIGKREEPYGFEDISKYIDYRIRFENADKKAMAEADRKIAVDMKKEIAHLSTNALIETFPNQPSSGYPYGYPELACHPVTPLSEDTFWAMAFQELLGRNDAGWKLLSLYSKDMHIEGSVLTDLAYLEILLAQPAIRLHLTPQQFEQLSEAIYKKQWEKYSESSIAYEPYNFLYIGAYDENGWDEEKLKEYADIYERPIVDAGREESKDIHFSKRRQQKILSEIRESTHPRWARFDDCQVSQL